MQLREYKIKRATINLRIRSVLNTKFHVYFRCHKHFVQMAFLAVETYLKLFDISLENKENTHHSHITGTKAGRKENKDLLKYQPEKLLKSDNLLGDCTQFLESLQHVGKFTT